MIIPALPAIQHDVGASPEAATWLLTAFLLTSSVSTPLLGRLGDMYGKEKVLLAVLGVFALGSLVSRDRRLDRRAHPRARDPGRRRRHLPARLRDHPRRVPARARGHLDRPDLGDVRHRRRPRPRAGRRDRRPPLRAVDLLVLGRRDQLRRLGHLALRARVAGARARRGSTGAGPRCCRSRWPRCCSASRRATRGAGARPACSGCSPRPSCSAPRSSTSSAACAEPMVDMRADVAARRVVHEPHRVRDRLRDVRLLRADPPARGAARR